MKKDEIFTSNAETGSSLERQVVFICDQRNIEKIQQKGS